jgi:hypothetical protein
MRIEVTENIFKHEYDNRIFEFNLLDIATDSMFFTLEDIFIDKCLGDEYESEYSTIITDNMFETVYQFIFYFIIELDKMFLTKVTRKKTKSIIYFDTFVYPKIEDKIFIIYNIENEKFMLNLLRKDYFYMRDYEDTIINKLLDKLNACEDIDMEDTQGHGYRYFTIKNGIKYDLFETYCDIDDEVLHDKVHIF